MDKKGTGTSNKDEEPLELLKALSYTPVSPFGNLEFSFAKEPDKVEIATWADEYLLSEEEGMYSLLEIYQEGYDGESLLDMTETTIVNERTWSEVTDLEATQGTYPGLEIQNLPYFALFDVRAVVFGTNSTEEMISYIENLSNTEKNN